MENRQTSKTVEINGRTYQVNKLDARTSCWLFAFLGERAGPNSMITDAFGRCTREQFAEIQNIALRQVFFMDTKGENTFPTAILSGNGTFTLGDLEGDAETVFQLMTASILFSLSPFLVEKESSSPRI